MLDGKKLYDKNSKYKQALEAIKKGASLRECAEIIPQVMQVPKSEHKSNGERLSSRCTLPVAYKSILVPTRSQSSQSKAFRFITSISSVDGYTEASHTRRGEYDSTAGHGNDDDPLPRL